MTPLRRRYAVLVALVAGVLAAPAHAIDQMKMMIPAGPGGGWDQTGRNLGAAMQAAGAVKSIQYENKGGAGGAIGLAQFLTSNKGDPNALIVAGMVTVGATHMNKSPVTLANVTPIARLTAEADAIVVSASSPIKNAKDLVAALKANPGAVSFAGGSAGGVDHLVAALIAKDAGVDPSKVNYVPFTSGPEAVAAVLGGQVAVGISGIGEFSQHIKAGRVRAIAVSSGSRLAGVDIPTLKEQGVNVELVNWRGVWGAPGISAEQKKALVAAVEAGLGNAKWKEAVERLDWTSFTLTGDAFGAFVESETKRIRAILDQLSLRAKQ
ncbi:MAG TPA: tripartite tricarboxylate transporter substrate-binding protein [Casimicrobiaceae bacterium]|nr:tripartite tricarboxylate transporter substrate-binding protein [Casimicrobiaceae bacterium]